MGLGSLGFSQWLTKASTISMWPYWTANCMGVQPHLVLELGFFTTGSRILTISVKPLQAAICMGVQPKKRIRIYLAICEFYNFPYHSDFT